MNDFTKALLYIEKCDVHKDTILSQFVTTEKIIKKFLDYFNQNYDDQKNISTLKTILTVLSNVIKTEGEGEDGESAMIRM